MPKIVAGITVFNPEEDRLIDNINATLLQVDKLYIVDNASSNTEAIKQKLSENEKIVLIENKENLGVATALNQMCESAINDGADFILTLDQDSLPEPDIIEKYSEYLSDEEIGLYTPTFADDNEAQIILSESEPKFTYVERCNTSASLVRLSAYKKVGGFDDVMFIDCVDFDFCTLLLENGYKILRVNGAVLHHRLGEAKEVRFFMPIGRILGIKKLNKPFYTYNHSPLRTYYYARNIRYYIAKHKDFIDIKTEKRVYLKWFVLKIFFEKQKIAKLKAIRKGKKDAKIMIKKYLNKGE